MVTKAEKVRAGVFVTVALTLVVAALLVVAGIRFLERHTTYYVEFKGSVGGLEKGTTVTYNGVPVGQVRDIRFSPNDIEIILVVLAVAPHTPVKVDTRASTKVKGITGGTVLELYGGTNDAERLPPHQVIGADRPFLEALTYDIPQVLQNFQGLLADLRGITDETNRERISKILADAEVFFGTGSESITAATRDLQEIARDLRDTTPRLTAMIGEMDTTLRNVSQSVTDGADAFRVTAQHAERVVMESDLEGLATDLRQVASNLKGWTEAGDPASVAGQVESTLTETRALVADLRRMVQTNGEAVSQALFNLHESTLVLQDFLKIVRSNPGLLLAPPRPPD